MKRLRNVFIVLALILSHAMCAFVAYAHRGMQCGIEHMGFSAPVDMAFLYAIPFAVGVMLCAGMAYALHRQGKRR